MIDRRQFSAGAAALIATGTTALDAAAAQSATGIWSRSEGSGRDIIFLHGWSMDHRDEFRVHEPIFARRPGWRRHYIDLPGMGRSPADPRIENLDDMLDAVLAWIEATLGDRPIVLAGTSAGALLALGALLRPRIRVDGILLRAPLIEPDDDRRDVEAPHPVIVDPALTRTLSDAERQMMGPLMIQTPAYLAAMRAKMREAVLPAIAAADTAFLSPIRADKTRYRLRDFSVDALPSFDRPSLILTGRLDASVGYRDAWRLMPHMPRATFATLDRAEHGLPIDQQPLFAALVGDWLDRLAETAAHPETAA